MSRLIVIARPSIVTGFHLAGIEAYPAANAPAVQETVERWLVADEEALLAIDEEYLAQMDTAFRLRLDKSNLLYLALPTGEPLPPETSSRARIAELIRQAIGFHITFQGGPGES